MKYVNSPLFGLLFLLGLIACNSDPTINTEQNIPTKNEQPKMDLSKFDYFKILEPYKSKETYRKSIPYAKEVEDNSQKLELEIDAEGAHHTILLDFKGYESCQNFRVTVDFAEQSNAKFEVFKKIEADLIKKFGPVSFENFDGEDFVVSEWHLDIAAATLIYSLTLSFNTLSYSNEYVFETQYNEPELDYEY